MEKLNHWLTLSANLGVLTGIVFLAMELKQNSEMTAAQTRSELSQSVINLIEMERHPILVEANLKLQRGDELELLDVYYLDNMANATLRHWENTYYQYQNGLFDDQEFEADFEVWREAMQTSSYRDHWQERRATYSQSFRNVIDQLIE